MRILYGGEHYQPVRIKVSTKYYPRLTHWHVRRALRWINPLDTVGIASIHIMDEETLAPGVRKIPFYLRDSNCGGEYINNRIKRKQQVSRINLFTRHLYHGIPAWLMLTPVATLRVAFVLAHEVGHHLIERRGYIYDATERYQPYGSRDKHTAHHEMMANKYAQGVSRSMSAIWYYKFARRCSGSISRWYFAFGMVDWKKQQYRRAAYYWFYSFCADPDNIDAVRGHKAAAAKVISTEEKSENRLQPAVR